MFAYKLDVVLWSNKQVTHATTTMCFNLLASYYEFAYCSTREAFLTTAWFVEHDYVGIVTTLNKALLAKGC